MNKRLTIQSLTLVAVILSSSLVFADVVARSPISCPAGTHLVTNHYGSDCAPDVCPAPSQPNICDGHGCCKVELCQLPGGACEEGFGCKINRLCTTPIKPAPNDFYREITSSCEDGSKCATGSTCEVVAACVSKKSVLSACSCGLAEDNEHGGPPLFVCVVAVAALLGRSAGRRF